MKEKPSEKIFIHIFKEKFETFGKQIDLSVKKHFINYLAINHILFIAYGIEKNE
jgi:hypothetical protein